MIRLEQVFSRSRGNASMGQRDLAHRARIAGLMILLAVGLAVASSISARAAQEVELRTVHGSVVDKDENPVPSSVVYLKNVKTQGVKTYIADDSGNYRFSGLDPNVDYEIHAEHNDLESATRNISSYDSRRDVNLVLKLSRKKAQH
ncbi:MAG TPA: carboxypeptidase-like regulatory domain-containing protein [Candidatus Limnocylindrales bacterium]|nr:carboxypeptidase-like regulatory domain-containing protein [Candidatus Limnocylindrales bacterium]